MIVRFFSHRVAWLMLCVALGIGALFAHTTISMRNGHWEYQLRTNANLSNTLGKGLEWSLDGVDATLQKTAIALLDAQALDTHDEILTPEHSALLDAVWRDVSNSQITVLNAAGKVVDPWVRGGMEGRSLAEHDFFQAFAQAQHKGVFIGRPTQDLIAGQYVLPVARAVQSYDGPVIGVVVGQLRLDEINQWLGLMNLGEHSGVNIIREDGLVLTRFPYRMSEQLHNLAGSGNLARFLAVPQGSFVSVAVIDGVERLYTHTRVGHYPLVINVAQATRTIWSEWVRNAWVLGVFTALLMAACMAFAVMLVRELSRRSAMQQALFTEKEVMRATLQSMREAVVCTDAQGRITYINPAAKALTGLRSVDADRQPVEILHPPVDPQAPLDTHSPVRQALANKASVERVRTQLLHRFSQQSVPMEGSANVLTTPEGAVMGTVVVLRDVTEAAAQEAQMRHLAFHDALTGLPNRLLLQDRAQQAMSQNKRSGELLAVVYLDLDGFKQINDTLGHRVGDEALRHIGRCLQACVRDSDTVSRLGGDEFVVLLPALKSEEHLLGIVQKIQNACGQPFVWEGQSYVLHASGGVSLFPEHGEQWDVLLNSADTAMYAAKKMGRHQIRRFHRAAEASLLTRAEVPAHAG